MLATDACDLQEPGGRIQWGEPDLATTCLVKGRADLQSQAAEELIQWASRASPRLMPSWVARLVDVFKAAGLKRVVEHRIDTPFPYLLSTYRCNLMFYDELMKRRGLSKEDEAHLRRLLALANIEAETGVATEAQRVTVTATKPHNDAS